MALGEERLRSIVESILLVAPEPVPVARLAEVICIEDPQTTEEAVKEGIQALIKAYAELDRPVGRGFRVEEVAGGLQLRTVAENGPYVRRFLAAKPMRLSKPALETLSVIAYRQPVTKPEIEAIRGVDVGAVLKALLERDYIRILGKKDEVGRPIIYGTTPNFLEFFGLRSLAELPTLREYHELDEEHQRQVDELEGEAEPPNKVSELAAAAEFLVERASDPDIDALDSAVADADRVRRVTDELLGVKKAQDASAPPDSTEGGGDHAPPADAPASASEKEPA